MGALPEFSPDLPVRRPRRKRYSERVQDVQSQSPSNASQLRRDLHRERIRRPVGPARVLASLAFVAGPALVAQAVLSQVLQPAPQQPLEGSTAAALLSQAQSLQNWLKQADEEVSHSALTGRLQAIQDRLSGLPASHCQLLSRNELLDLNSRLTIDLAAGGDRGRTPSWQTRYKDQINIAARNLQSCLHG